MAAAHGQFEMAQWLLNNGANVNTPSHNAQIPLHDFEILRQLGIVRLFLDNGANIDTQGKYGNTPLHRAARHDLLEISRCLVHHHANIYSQNNQQETPEQVAREGSKTAAFLIKQRQIDIAARVHCWPAMKNQGNQDASPLQGLPPEMLDNIISHLPIMRPPVNDEQRAINHQAINHRAGLYFSKLANRNTEATPTNNEDLANTPRP
jgi:ankyrin repeat protein